MGTKRGTSRPNSALFEGGLVKQEESDVQEHTQLGFLVVIVIHTQADGSNR